jgi:hypothetical protein
MKLSFDEYWALGDVPGTRDDETTRKIARNAWDAALAQQAHDICENSRACIRCQAVIEPNMAICFACHTQQAQPRCAMCDKPIPAGCRECTEYALDAVGAPQQAQPLTDEMIEAKAEETFASWDNGNADRWVKGFTWGAKWARDRMAQQAQPEDATANMKRNIIRLALAHLDESPNLPEMMKPMTAALLEEYQESRI